MKILAIRGKNLASLEKEFSIDFNKPPLSNSRILVITGKTGAGKSTILDALCLALYDKTPRTSHISENIKIKDVQGETINHKDSRITLRKGAGEGFAQVDFEGIDKKEYRSTWKVRRAHGRPDGALQSTEMILENLSDGVYEKGTKQEILKKIVLLIGLNFDQFTRSVLLSQGDFASFLKASQNEKAELLEKITGTNIYTKISQLIYEKHKDIKKDFDYKDEVLKKDKNSLLEKEKIELLLKEYNDLKIEINNINNSINSLTFKLKWFNDYKTFFSKWSEAKKEFKNAETQNNNLLKRENYIKLVENVRDNIKEEYKKYNANVVSIKSKIDEIQKEEEILQESQNKLKFIESTLCKLNDEKQKIKDNYKKLKVDIEKARDLDYKIENYSKSYESEKEEYESLFEEWQKTNKSLQETKKEIENKKILISTLEKWFIKNQKSEDVCNNLNLILEYIDTFYKTYEQISENNKKINRLKANLDDNNDKLINCNKDLNDLEKSIPSEVQVIQDRLSDGDICPVCGNVYHKGHKVVSKSLSLRNEQIIDQKKKLSKEIEILENDKQNLNQKITILETEKAGLNKSKIDSLNKLKKYNNNLPSNWPDLLSQGRLVDHLNDINNTWENQKKLLSEIESKLNNLNISAELLSNQIKNKSNIDKKREKVAQLKEQLRESKSKRLELLDGKKVVDIENNFNEIEKDNEEKINYHLEEKLNISKKVEAKNATVNQFKISLEKLNKEQIILQDNIQNWLNRNSISIYQFKELVEVSNEWLNREKDNIDKVEKNYLNWKVTLKERKENLDNHIKNKPIDFKKEDVENSSYKIELLNKSLEEKNKNKNSIELLITQNNNLIKECEKKEKELELLHIDLDNWGKLNDLLGSASGAKFKQIAQCYTLDILLDYANHHLQNLAKRYVLEKEEDTLALNIIDKDMFNEVRSIHSLSGGETFLISLSLALGLSSISSNMMKVETLFIDEGFGSLDKDTLNIALDALEMLQNQGRRIGVISHVPEISERVQTQIKVIKENNGKSIIKICSN